MPALLYCASSSGDGGCSPDKATRNRPAIAVPGIARADADRIEPATETEPKQKHGRPELWTHELETEAERRFLAKELGKHSLQDSAESLIHYAREDLKLTKPPSVGTVKNMIRDRYQKSRS
jgi:hypothetical protein